MPEVTIPPLTLESDVPATPSRPKPVVLLILDGWGHRDDPTDNALAQATLPNWDALVASAPHTLIHTEGRHEPGRHQRRHASGPGKGRKR